MRRATQCADLGPKKPTASRFFGTLIVLAGVLLCAPTGAQPTPIRLTEEECVNAALEDDALVGVATAMADAREAEAVRLETWLNPEIGYTREQTFRGAEAMGEDAVVLSQTLRLSGRHRLRARASREQAEAELLAGLATRRGFASVIRERFYDLLATQDRLRVYAEWLELMQQVTEDLQRRVSAGESAPYELKRVQKEIADIEAAAAVDRAELAAAQTEIALLIDSPIEDAPRLRAEGQLMPAGLPDEQALLDAIANRPDLRAAAARGNAAATLEEAAKRWWVPDPRLEAGYLGVDGATSRAHGFIVGLRFALPVVSTAKGDRLAAQALRRRLENQSEFLSEHTAAEVLGLASRVRALAQAAQTYEADGVGTALKVVETARLAYGAGELGILELIDSYRGLVAARLEVVRIATQARESEIELWKSMAIGPQAALEADQ